MMATEQLRQPDFQHELHILPPLDDDGRTVWCGYLDEPGRWRRMLPALDQLLAAATLVLIKLLEYERAGGARNPNYTTTVPAVPDVEPHWRVRVTADCSEQEPEWTLELLDDTAWATSGYDLRICRDKLAQRLEAARVTPVAMPAQNLPVPIRPDQVIDVQLAGSSVRFEEAAASYLSRIEHEIEEQRQVLVLAQAKIDVLTHERQALRAALAAYSRASSKGQKSRRGGHEAMSDRDRRLIS